MVAVKTPYVLQHGSEIGLLYGKQLLVRFRFHDMSVKGSMSLCLQKLYSKLLTIMNMLIRHWVGQTLSPQAEILNPPKTPLPKLNKV